MENHVSLKISTEDIENRKEYRERIRKHTFEQISNTKRTEKKWTEERTQWIYDRFSGIKKEDTEKYYESWLCFSALLKGELSQKI